MKLLDKLTDDQIRRINPVGRKAWFKNYILITFCFFFVITLKIISKPIMMNEMSYFQTSEGLIVMSGALVLALFLGFLVTMALPLAIRNNLRTYLHGARVKDFLETDLVRIAPTNRPAGLTLNFRDHKHEILGGTFNNQLIYFQLTSDTELEGYALELSNGRGHSQLIYLPKAWLITN